MSEKKYISHIEKPEVHTTSKGGSYVTPFDVVRSVRGREVIKSHAATASGSRSQKQSESSVAPLVRKAAKSK